MGRGGPENAFEAETRVEERANPRVVVWRRECVEPDDRRRAKQEVAHGQDDRRIGGRDGGRRKAVGSVERESKPCRVRLRREGFDDAASAWTLERIDGASRMQESVRGK